MSPRWFAAAVLLVATACSTPRGSYVRRDLAPGALALASPNGRLMILQGRAAGGPMVLSLDTLGPAVACVPDAVAYVDAAKSLRTTGRVMKWIGWAAAIAGTAVFVYAAIQQDDRYLRPAVSVASSGGLLTQTPDFLAPFAKMKMLDAVHAYMDQRRALPSCGLAPRPPPRPAPVRTRAPEPKPEGGPGPGGPRF